MLRRCLAPLVLATLLVAACSSDDDPSIKPAEGSTTTSAKPGGTASPDASSTTSPGGTAAPTSTTTPAGPATDLTGPGGTVRFTYELAAARSELCFRIDADAPVASARILRSTGDPVLDLPVGQGQSEINSCAATDSITLEEIERDPAQFQAEVKTAKGTTKAPLR